MFTLLGEVNLWTFDDNINIKDTDFGAFRYHDKRIDNLHEEGKRSYTQKRGMIYVPTNKKGNKLKDSIKYLEEQLRDNTIIYCQWYDECVLQLMLSNALLIQIQVNDATGDIRKITFDKYLVGKLLEHISDVTITKNHILFTYNDNQVTLVHFARSKRHIFDKINKLEPKLFTNDLFGPNGRRIDKKIQTNKSGDLILIWWKSTMNEVYPWSPAVKEHDRANIHLYRLIGSEYAFYQHNIVLWNFTFRIKLELICYVRSEFDPLYITFDARHDNIIHSVEQKVSRKGEVTVEWRTYQVSQQDKLQRIAVISVPLPTHSSCMKFSPNQELLLLCCIDGSVIIYDQTRATTASVKAAFIPTLASWHSDGIIFIIGNDRGQFQHFDISLSCIKSQTLSEEATPANILDLSPYFRIQPALLRVEWNKKNDPDYCLEFYNHGNSLLLLLFQRGPMGVIKVLEGDTFLGDALVKRYLSLSQVEQATSLLLSMNWDTYPRACMHTLNQILNYLFKLPLTPERENLIQNALGSFHVPVKPISQATEDEYGDEIRDLTRRFFHHLLRYQMFEKAFRLAIDLNDHDLFMDIHFYALVLNDVPMATAAKEKAEHILSRSNSCSSSHSTCSRASCSICSDSTSDKGDESCSEDSEDSSKETGSDVKHSKSRNYRKEPDSQIPPLPVLRPHHDSKNLAPTSFTDLPPSNKNDCNLVSTSFNIPNDTLAKRSFNHSSHLAISNSFFTSTSFNSSAFKTHTNLTSTSTVNTSNLSSQSFDNISDDLMTTSFGSLSLNERKSMAPVRPTDNCIEATLKKSLLNDELYSFNTVPTDTITISLAQENSFISTPFNNPSYECISVDIPSDPYTSSLDNMDSNIMSTSFSTRISDTSTMYDSSFNNLTMSSKCDASLPLLLKQSSAATHDFTSKPSFDSVTTSKLTSTPYNVHANLMSTSFSFHEDRVSDSGDNNVKTFAIEDKQNIIKLQQPLIGKKQVDFNIPPPPSLTSSFSNYFQNFPRKNVPLSRSTPGLTDMDESIQKFSSAKTIDIASRLLQKQNSTSNISQIQHKHTNTKPSKCYRLNYDLDYIPFHRSYDNIDINSSVNSMKLGTSHFHPMYNTQTRFDGRSPKLTSSQNSVSINSGKEVKTSNIPPLPVIIPSNSDPKTCSPCPTFMDAPLSVNEKPKVKFSDTVTHILVPGTSQPYRQKRSTVTQVHLTDPKRELAESLPLCLGNEDYLKDFQPLSKEDSNNKAKETIKLDEASKIKVVHFGLL